MANNANAPDSTISPLAIILMVIAVAWAFTNRQAAEPVKPEPPKPDQVEVPAEKLKPTPDQCWEALAKCVENKWIGGELQQHTDHIVKLADSLKTTGSIPDTSRIEQWRAKRVEITDANRAEIARQIRGM